MVITRKLLFRTGGFQIKRFSSMSRTNNQPVHKRKTLRTNKPKELSPGNMSPKKPINRSKITTVTPGKEKPSLGNKHAFYNLFQTQIDNYFANNKLRMGKENEAILKNIMQQVYLKQRVLFAFDVEAWEGNNNLVTEIGIAIYEPKGQELSSIPQIKQIHIVIEEHKHKRNGRFVPDKKEHFGGSSSILLSLKSAANLLNQLIAHYFEGDGVSNEPSLFVGHQIGGDIKWLQSIGVNFPASFDRSKDIVDTATIYRLSHGKSGGSLKNSLRLVNIPHANLHNAGNDAYYTLLVAFAWTDPSVRQLNQLDIHAPLSQEEMTDKKYIENGELSESERNWQKKMGRRSNEITTLIRCEQNELFNRICYSEFNDFKRTLDIARENVRIREEQRHAEQERLAQLEQLN